MSGLLDRILATKRAEVDALLDGPTRKKNACYDIDVGHRAACERGSRSLAKSNSSNAAGALSRAMTCEERAIAYASSGASMISVLCDKLFFDGSYEDVTAARAALDARGFSHVPILAKEFVLDRVQLDVARAAGASAGLIARILSDGELGEAVACREISLEPFVEVADEAELARAIAADARVIGVNARDLDALDIDAARAERVIAQIPATCVAVHLPGVRDPTTSHASRKHVPTPRLSASR